MHQYHSAFITVALWYRMKTGSMIPPALFLFLKIILAIQVLFASKHFKIICSSSVKNAICILIEVPLNL